MRTVLAVLILVGAACLFAAFVFAVDPEHWQGWSPAGIIGMWGLKAWVGKTLWKKPRDNDTGPVE